MLFGPDDHAKNGPETWNVVKAAPGHWHLVAASGAVLDYFETRREAVAAITSGTIRRLYDDETRWFAGESVRGWRPWAEMHADQLRRQSVVP